MIRLLQSSWTACGIGLVVYLATMVAAWRPYVQPPPDLGIEAHARVVGPSWAYDNPEADLLINELKKEKEAFAAKEKDLNDLASRLQTERAELNQLTQTVHQVQAEFDRNVTRIHEQESANLKRLAKMYSTMTPEGAATVFKALDDSTLVKVLTYMKDTETAAILEVLARQGEAQAKRVAGVSDRLRLSLAEESKKSSSP
jgi:flagellar motility protein MotE (MotC chaperone)